MGHIFISYSHKDTEYAHALADNLHSMGFPVWMDARLDYGSQWPHEIQKHLDSCDAFILVMTPRSFASDWVQSELQRAKRKLKPIFPLLLEGDEPWLSVESIQYYDVRSGELPDDEFYADLKRAMSAKQTAPNLLPIQGSVRKSEPVKTIRPGTKAVGLVAALAILGICLVIGVPVFQRVVDSLPFLIPTRLENIAPPLAFTLTPISSTSTAPTLISLPVELPDGSEVTMIAPWGDKYQYTILSARREPLSPDKLLLHLRIRASADSISGMNFWSDSFRLVAGDLRIVPVNDLNEVVNRDETVDGDVEFEIHPSLKEAVLLITVGRNPDSWATQELRLIFP